MLSLVADHYVSLLDGDAPNGGSFALPQPPAVLDSDRAGLKEIAAVLVTPPFSGLLLGRDQIARIARALELPRGFGDRGQMLTNLLRTAAQYDRFPAVVAAVETVAAGWRQAYADTAAAAPALAPFAAPWLAQTQHTLDLLAEMRAASPA